ncbi:MAG: putative selenate ABC transporter substrate-binding protein [Gallionella sp.]
MKQVESRIRRKYLAYSIATVAGLLLLATMYSEPVLRISYMPEETPSVLKRKLKPLTEYLESRVGMKIEFRPALSGDALVVSLLDKNMDMVWMDGYRFVQAKARSNDHVIPIVQREQDAATQSVFISRDKDITRLEDLRNRAFAFGPKTSASGYLLPRTYLLAAHINPDTDMERVDFSASDEATVDAVNADAVSAGVLNRYSWERLIDLGKVDPKEVRVFFTTSAYHDYNWAVRTDMDENLRNKLSDAFLALDQHNAKDKVILDLQRASRYIPAKVEDYAAIEAAVQQSGLVP